MSLLGGTDGLLNGWTNPTTWNQIDSYIATIKAAGWTHVNVLIYGNKNANYSYYVFGNVNATNRGYMSNSYVLFGTTTFKAALISLGLKLHAQGMKIVLQCVPENANGYATDSSGAVQYLTSSQATMTAYANEIAQICQDLINGGVVPDYISVFGDGLGSGPNQAATPTEMAGYIQLIQQCCAAVKNVNSSITCMTHGVPSWGPKAFVDAGAFNNLPAGTVLNMDILDYYNHYSTSNPPPTWNPCGYDYFYGTPTTNIPSLAKGVTDIEETYWNDSTVGLADAAAKGIPYYLEAVGSDLTNPNAINFDQDWCWVITNYPTNLPKAIGWCCSMNSITDPPPYPFNGPTQLDANGTAMTATIPIGPPPTTYNLIIQAATGGSTLPTPGTYPYNSGANVTITETPASGNSFSYWLVDGVNSGITTASIIINMNTNHTVTPVFTAITPPTGGTVGNTTIGTYIDSNDPNEQSITFFTPNFTGPITDIFAYIAAPTPGNAMAAIYAASSNVPGALQAQSNQVAVGATPSWVDFPLPSAINVTSGVQIGLAIMGNVSITIYEVVGVGQRTGGPGKGSYASGFSNPFGTIWFNDTTGGMSIYATNTTPIAPTQTYIVNWAITPTSGNLPFTISFSGYLSRNSSTPDTGTIVNGETIQVQAIVPGGSTWANTGITATTGAGPSGNGYFSGTLKLAEPTIYPGAWQFRAYYAGNTTKNLFGCVKGGKTRDLSKVNALIL